jgi:hypothetical protein
VLTVNQSDVSRLDAAISCSAEEIADVKVELTAMKTQMECSQNTKTPT